MASPSDRFRQIISYALVVGRDAHGNPLLGPVSPARARVQPSRRLIRDASGNEQLASHVIYTDVPLTLQHRLWLPGEDTSDFNRARRPAAVDELVDGAGAVSFLKVWL
ncbi:hypothetical protein [Comamonas sp. JC664]|uniref:hypothetical protein n=1 Tax=Comamonas sp. JC664 TaxID=2801917 RepID=UPI00174A2BA3|nr:hypothetical protein [Comamonas sp. JC664]MBL0692951.1 hypothetical protein [Comamonas sp. JC664]GHG91402.1 hypothetical protein GCM10012319_52210 [Comamonas sp. KCTC 72670]